MIRGVDREEREEKGIKKKGNDVNRERRGGKKRKGNIVGRCTRERNRFLFRKREKRKGVGYKLKTTGGCKQGRCR